jgi:hypothetical protein
MKTDTESKDKTNMTEDKNNSQLAHAREPRGVKKLRRRETPVNYGVSRIKQKQQSMVSGIGRSAQS